jgi:general secretion pathway protein G
MQMQAEIPSGSWPLEQMPSQLAAIGRKLRDREFLFRLAVTTAILSALAVGATNASAYLVRRHRETVLHQDLTLLRATIREYTADEHHAPHRLMDLVEQGYMVEMPADPFTGKPDWDPDFAVVPDTIDREHFGIVNVHSHATDRGRDGTAYCLW